MKQTDSKKHSEDWLSISSPSVSMNFTEQFLMYVSDAVWHVEHSVAWNKKLLNFLIISQNESDEESEEYLS